jgi:hypothetical protein
MLPGLRFLFAAIVFSMSVLVFGLGAAALLRAAHEQFASIPLRRAPPETVFAQPQEAATPEAATPVLATLRVDPPAAEPTVPTDKASENIPAAPPAVPDAIVTAPAEPAPIAALTPDDSSPPATEKPEITVAETPAPGEAAPAQADAPAPAPTDEIKIAATADVSPSINEAAPAASEQAGAPASPDTDLASTKIATLGGPPVTVEPPAQTAHAKADGSLIKKRVQARRAKERRRLAQQRARLARQAPQQPAAQTPDLFPQPTITTRTR